jgi:hypothetical protein
VGRGGRAQRGQAGLRRRRGISEAQDLKEWRKRSLGTIVLSQRLTQTHLAEAGEWKRRLLFLFPTPSLPLLLALELEGISSQSGGVWAVAEAERQREWHGQGELRARLKRKGTEGRDGSHSSRGWGCLGSAAASSVSVSVSVCEFSRALGLLLQEAGLVLPLLAEDPVALLVSLDGGGDPADGRVEEVFEEESDMLVGEENHRHSSWEPQQQQKGEEMWEGEKKGKREKGGNRPTPRKGKSSLRRVLVKSIRQQFVRIPREGQSEREREVRQSRAEQEGD